LGQGELIEPELVVAESDTCVSVLGDDAAIDTAFQCDLCVDQVLQNVGHIMLGQLLVDHEVLPGPAGKGARPPSVAALTFGRLQHDVDGVDGLAAAPLHEQRHEAHEVHTRWSVCQIAGRFSQGLLGQSQRLVVLAALRALEQAGHECSVNSHALTPLDPETHLLEAMTHVCGARLPVGFRPLTIAPKLVTSFRRSVLESAGD
jgi:hypothetical protein